MEGGHAFGPDDAAIDVVGLDNSDQQAEHTDAVAARFNGHSGPIGTDDGRGHPRNPVTGQPYAPQRVLLGDFGRVMAEYWADGPRSETPPVPFSYTHPRAHETKANLVCCLLPE